ncbi:MAG: CBS domain-containing protein [Planctomycetes bacterium]|nr:CBS domain-containing protein [Planctomycetota bacterium]
MADKIPDLSIKVKDIMTSPVLFIQADWTIAEAIKFFIDHRFTGAPVSDSNGNAIGVVSFKDVAEYTLQQFRGEIAEQITQLKVEHIMSPGVVCIDRDASLKEALRILIEKHFHRIFVKDSKDSIIGVVSTFDVIRWLKNNSDK